MLQWSSRRIDNDVLDIALRREPSPSECEQLRLEDNQLGPTLSLPVLGHFTGLTLLALDNNRLACFPDVAVLQRMPLLRNLTLSSNVIVTLPRAVSTLTTLNGLDLRFNRVRDVAVLGALGALEHLGLMGNPVEPDSLARNSAGVELVQRIGKEYGAREAACRRAMLALCVVRRRTGARLLPQREMLRLIAGHVWNTCHHAAWSRTRTYECSVVRWE